MAGLNKNVYNVNKIRLSNVTDVFDYIPITKTDICSVFISVGILIADAVSDFVLVCQYMQQNDYFSLVTFLVSNVMPAIVIQVLSIRMCVLHNITTRIHWLTHCCLLGVMHRYTILMRLHWIEKSSQNMSKICHQRSEVGKLHLLYCFMKSAPQAVLQLYLIVSTQKWNPIRGVSAVLSLIHISWTLLTYYRAIPSRSDSPTRLRLLTDWLFRVCWSVCMLAARITALVLVVICFEYWIILVLGVHWLASMGWIIKTSTSTQTTAWTILDNGIYSITYCFSYIDFQENRKFRHMLIFYIVLTLENVCFLIVPFICKSELITKKFKTITTSLVISSTITGLGLIILYHNFFGRVKFKKKIIMDMETAGNVSNNIDLKNSDIIVKKKKMSNDVLSEKIQKDGTNAEADRKLLLENLVARSGTPTFISTPIIDESSTDVLFHSINTTAEDIQILNVELDNSINNKLKRRGICLPIELGLQPNYLNENEDLFFEDFNKTNELSARKRHGICSSIQLEQYNDLLTENISMDNILTENILIENILNDENSQNDVKIKRKPIYVTFEDVAHNDVLNSCEIESKLSDDSKYTFILSAPSEIMSAHDYENVCAVNIAREFWGLRSWKGYSDIETWLHDDSIVQDNVTSTVTTSNSSEISSSDGFDSENNKSFVQDSLKTLGSKCAKYSEQKDVFIAKPYFIDQNIITTLEPIKEELEEVECGSTLVTTIDVIRKNTASNSPRYVYHRTEHILESPTIRRPKSLWGAATDSKPIYENNPRNKINSKILLKLCDNELKNCDNLTNIINLDKPVISNSLQSLVSSSSSDDILSIAEIARCFPLVKKPSGRPRRKFSLIRDRFEMTVRNKTESCSSVSGGLQTKRSRVRDNVYVSNDDKENFLDSLGTL